MPLPGLARLTRDMADAKAPPIAASAGEPPAYEPWQQQVAASLAGGMIAATGRGHSMIEAEATFRRVLGQVFGKHG